VILAWLIGKVKAAARPRGTKTAFYLLLALTAVVLGLVLILGFLLRFNRVQALFPRWVHDYGEAFSIIWVYFAFSFVVLMLLAMLMSRVSVRLWPEHREARRRFLNAAPAAALALPAAVMGYGVFVERQNMSLREQRVKIANLPAGLQGLKIVQVTDIHAGPFLSLKQVARAVDMANEARANIAVVTGDLISAYGDPLDGCLDALGKLRAEAGVFGCLGNHEVFADSEQYTTERGAKLGIRFLRQASEKLRFGGATLNLAGVDFQSLEKRRYLIGAEEMVDPGAFNLLLSHNPDVFPVAARQGYQFVISGHTHGGQVRVEILHQDLNVARFHTKYVDGVYLLPTSSIFVCRGIGTIGIPARLGAPPEIALITLERA